MTNKIVDTAIEILGKVYLIKCPEPDIAALKKAAQYLEEQMRNYRAINKGISYDRIAIVTALNVIHQSFVSENQQENYLENLNQRLHQLQHRIDAALVPQEQLELQTE